jgi:hypothetical protein
MQDIFGQQLGDSSSPAQAGFRSGLLAIAGTLLADTLCCWILRVSAGQDFGGALLLLVPFVIHLACGAALWQMFKHRAKRRATRIGERTGWVIALPVCLWINFMLNFHIVW